MLLRIYRNSGLSGKRCRRGGKWCLPVNTGAVFKKDHHRQRGKTAEKKGIDNVFHNSWFNKGSTGCPAKSPTALCLPGAPIIYTLYRNSAIISCGTDVIFF